MEPESSIPYSQVPATCPCPEPTSSSPQNPLPVPEIPSYCYPPIYVWVSPMVSFPQASPPEPCSHPSPPPYAPVTTITVHKNISTKKNIFQLFLCYGKHDSKKMNCAERFCIMDPAVTETDHIRHIRLDSGGQTTISGIGHSNAIITLVSSSYSVITLNKNYR